MQVYNCGTLDLMKCSVTVIASLSDETSRREVANAVELFRQSSLNYSECLRRDYKFSQEDVTGLLRQAERALDLSDYAVSKCCKSAGKSYIS